MLVLVLTPMHAIFLKTIFAVKKAKQESLSMLTQYTVHSTQYCTVHTTPYVHSTHYTLHSTQYTLHTTQYTVHSTHYTLYTTHRQTTQYTLHTTHYTLHSLFTLFLRNTIECPVYIVRYTLYSSPALGPYLSVLALSWYINTVFKTLLLLLLDLT